MRQPNFVNLNYYLRPNKNVERKLILEIIRSGAKIVPILEYAYIGFGSMWFVDFSLFHRGLQISRMHSIEKEVEWFQRAQANKPFDCVTVHPGESVVVLPELLKGIERPTIVWLDYEGPLDADILTDLRTFCRHAQPASFIAVTVNSVPRNYRTDSESYRDFLSGTVGDLLPPHPEKIKRKGLPKVLAEILFNCLDEGAKKAGREPRFQPVLNYRYKDGAQMVTVGGFLDYESQTQRLVDGLNTDHLGFATGREQMQINVPQLTLKEKATLDQLLPADKPPSSAQLEDLGLFLIKEQVEDYVKFYRYYPNFVEVTI